METAYIALGANLPSPAGEPRQTLDAAVLRLAELGRVLAQSSYYETAPVGYADQPTFLNAAVALEIALESTIEPESLLAELLAIERDFGRDRTHAIPNGPRTLDLDLLLYGERTVNTPTLQLPHPRMTKRRFVLLPLAEIAPALILPQTSKSVAQYLQELPQS